jgi:hypothetical protein
MTDHKAVTTEQLVWNSSPALFITDAWADRGLHGSERQLPNSPA